MKRAPWIDNKIVRYKYDFVSAEYPIHWSQRRIQSIVEAPHVGYDMHYPFELGIVIQGCREELYQNWKTRLYSGQAWFCGIWEPHGYVVRRAPYLGLVIIIRPDLLAKWNFPAFRHFDWTAPFFAPPGKRPQTLPQQHSRLINLAKRLMAIPDPRSENGQLWGHILLMEILASLMENWPKPPLQKSAPADFQTPVNRAVGLIFANQRLIPIKEAARECGLRPRLFSSAFQQVMGISFSEFSMRFRISGAREQIAATNDSIKAIALSWGFADESHFRHTFNRYYKCSPSAYRAQQQNMAGEALT